MKAGKHPDKKLTAVGIRVLTKPGRYADGNGLYLVVEPSGAKRWILRTMVLGKRRDIGLGGLQTVTLAEAREKALEMRKAARSGRNPIAERKSARRIIPTFAEAAQNVHEAQKTTWKNSKHADQWINTLAQYAVPTIGSMPIHRIGPGDLLRVLSPIWITKPETARRVRQRIKTVFDWGKAAGFIDGENPINGVAAGLPKQNERVKHHAALPYTEIPDFIRWLDKNGSGIPTKTALKLLILTATRTSEVLNSLWSEFDLEKGIWTIPAARMKAGLEFQIPLGPEAVQCVRNMAVISGNSGFVFPGQKPGKPLSNMTFLKVIRSFKPSMTGHGFRSAFRDWSAEKTNFPNEVCESALAHTVKNKTEKAYRRTNYLEIRRELMIAWESHILGPA